MVSLHFTWEIILAFDSVGNWPQFPGLINRQILPTMNYSANFLTFVIIIP